MTQQRETRPRKEHIVAKCDPNIPWGECKVIVKGKVVYEGRLGVRMTPYIVSGAMLVLHPVDFEDGQEFMRRFN